MLNRDADPEGEMMPGCILHIAGNDFDPHTVLASMNLRPYSVFRKGDKLFPNGRSQRRHDFSGFKCDVSQDDGVLSHEIADAIAFLKTNQSDLRCVTSFLNVDTAYLDFGYYSRFDGDRCVIQCETLPVELLSLCGSLKIEIMLSIYPNPAAEPKPDLS